MTETGATNNLAFVGSSLIQTATIVPWPAPTLTFVGSDGLVIIAIKPDGTIKKGPAFATDDRASIEFLDCLARVYPEWRNRLIATSAGATCP